MNSKENLLKAKSMYENNEEVTLKEVSEVFNINSKTFSKFLKSSGVIVRRGYNPSIKKYIKGKEMYLNGNSINYISKELDISRSRFSQYLKKSGIDVKHMRHKIYFKNDVFKKIDTEEKAYWLGFLYADGYIRSGKRCGIEIGLSENDVGHLYKFRDFLDTTHKVSFRKNKLGNSCRISIEDGQIHSDLIKLGCTPKKSLTLTFPTNKQVPKSLHRHFIRGYFDGDGGITFTEKTTSINILGTKEFLNGIKRSVKLLEDKKLYPMRYDDTNKNTFRIQFEGKKDIKCFLEYLYKDSQVYLDRKYEKYINFVCRPTQ